MTDPRNGDNAAHTTQPRATLRCVVSDMRAGAPEGFAELFDHEFERLVRCLRALDDDAADAVQEAFVQAFLRWRHVSTLEDPAGWVRRVAVNRLLNVKRSRRRGDAARARLPERATPLDPDERVDLRDAVRSLPAQQRAAVALFYGGDLSVREIADAMEISEGTVKSHLHDGRARLRNLLELVDE